MCSFAVASSGKRCLLETSESSDGTIAYQCKSSEVVVKNMPEWVENNECVSACGIDRYSVGISSDSLLEPEFAARLCSPACYQNCPNIVDLYYSLALAEGVFLPDLCKAQQTNPRRAMAELLSSGAASGPVSAASGPASAEAAGPMSSESSASLACAPASI
ncbi:uncharacterized protein LOC132269721 [Cornus florida]|uniref:uncharacterized protein LOC132269721 n=1 Tax=Cornus florida TaxID=4283 RepID=UPI00289C811B|nr:uncharacterized protein LOC132269721 [Cornus florida]